MQKKLLAIIVSTILLILSLPVIPIGGITASAETGVGSDNPDIVNTQVMIQELTRLGLSKSEIALVVDALTLKTPVAPKDFVDPVTLAVQKLQSHGMSVSEVVEALKPLGMGWNPQTGSRWRGRAATPEEMRALKRTDETIMATKLEAGMYTNSMWYGISNEMKPGSLAIQEDETNDHLATTHVRDSSGYMDVGVYRWLENTNWRFFTFDSNDGTGYAWHGNTTASTCRIHVKKDPYST